VERALTPGDIAALIHLLGDEDHWVKEHARTRLREAGVRAAPFLEDARSGDAEPAVRDESESLLDDIRLDDLERDWVALQAVEEGVALREGAFLLERLIHPDRVERQAVAREDLGQIVAGAEMAVPVRASAAARFEALRVYIHETCGFRGNTDDYYDPENSFLSTVVARRTGIPITLALVYLEIGRRIGVPIVGVGMPMHFLVARRTGAAYRFVDPFYSGREVSRGECLLLLERAGYEPAEGYLRPAPVVGILERMARNLTVIYQHSALDRELRLARRFVTMLTGEVV
jgi:regulator of sirC expression with transglutaminase-like and TPR domain